ncbi:MAG: hypothetical protein ACR2N6_00005, partial [Miltoncostaeaceae bacterium]
MRYFLPPPGPARVRREIPRIGGLRAVEDATDPTLDLRPDPGDSGHLARVRRIDPGSGDDYL